MLNKSHKSSRSKDQLADFERLILQAKLSVKDFIAFCKSKEFDHFDEAMNAMPSQNANGQFGKILTVRNND